MLRSIRDASLEQQEQKQQQQLKQHPKQQLSSRHTVVLESTP
jgi:hypothetical protein